MGQQKDGAEYGPELKGQSGCATMKKTAREVAEDMRLKEGTLRLGNVKMDYIAFGNGTKPLVMIQGLNTRGIKGAGASLAWMYRIFASDYRVYLFDRRAVLPESITVRELAADVAMAMDALQLTDAHVLGVSQGGMMAQYLAIDRPDTHDGAESFSEIGGGYGGKNVL